MAFCINIRVNTYSPNAIIWLYLACLLDLKEKILSDVMLHGVLNMPPDLWSFDPIDVHQRHDRYRQASKKIDALSAALQDLLNQISGCDGTAQLNLDQAIAAINY